MEPGQVLELMRPLVVVVDGVGGVRAVHGGCGGFLGRDPRSLLGSNLLDLVAPDERDVVAAYFLARVGAGVPTTLLPLPFRVKLLAANGVAQSVDVIPTGRPDDPDIDGWVVVLVPLSMQAGSSRSLDAELAGATRHEVKQFLAEELAIDDAGRTTRLFLVDMPSRHVTGGRVDEFGLGELVQRAINGGWEPWRRVGTGHGDVEAVRDVASRPVREHPVASGWHLIEAAPVMLDGELVAAFVRLSRCCNRSVLGSERADADPRIRGLVEVARLLYGRWRDQDALVAAAMTDQLTGLANKETLTLALALREEAVAVVYIDIDRFRDVNDEWGHAIGDRVLIEVARRISSACRRDDVVSRIGGDEFVVLLRHVDAVIAQRICRRIIDEVALPLGLPEGPRHVSVSIGLAIDTTVDDMVEHADQAMLAAKRQGRSRLVTA